MDQVQAAAKMAGDWWAERLHDKYAERRPALAAAVAQRVADALNGAADWDFQGNRCDGSGKTEAQYWVECDYEPKGLLANAVAEVFNDMKPWQLFSSSQDLFPYKHELRVARDALHPKEGYGNWTADIRVPASCSQPLRGEAACKHGIRSPHECRACADEPTDTAIAEWMRGVGEAKP